MSTLCTCIDPSTLCNAAGSVFPGNADELFTPAERRLDGGSRMRGLRACATSQLVSGRRVVDHSSLISQRVKMSDGGPVHLNIPDFDLLVNVTYTPVSLKHKSICVLVKSLIVRELAEKHDVHHIIEHKRREDININRLVVVDCPGNRFSECNKWEQFHISCYVSRAYQMLIEKVLAGMDWASKEEVEKIRFYVENKFKIRLLSVIDSVNTSRDNITVCKRYHRVNKTKECIECMFYVMMEKYYKKKLEEELLNRDYWDKCDQPIKGFCKNMDILYKAVQNWEQEENIDEYNEEVWQHNREKRQMNDQFGVSKRSRTEVVEDDVLLEDEFNLL